MTFINNVHLQADYLPWHSERSERQWFGQIPHVHDLVEFGGVREDGVGPPANHDLDERPHGVIRVLTLGHSVEKK